MATLPIVLYPQSILQQRAREVGRVTLEIQELIPQMIEAMYKNQGIGLAAPQVGISKRVIIVESSPNPRQNPRKPLAFMNPEIIKKSKKQTVEEEGCLSLPGIFLLIKRTEKVEVRCQTLDGNKVTIQAKGLAARIFQHEIDHLNGKLIIHRISPLKRLKIQKLLKELKNRTERK